MKKIIFAFMLAFLITTLSSVLALASTELPVLMYHNVTEDISLVNADATVHITPDTLEEHFKSLKSAGYNTISLDDYYRYRKGEISLPPNPVIITFDDGYSSNYEYAYPLLKKYNMKAVIFVVASRVGATDTQFKHFTWQQAREMENSGFVEIESHSYSHADFSKLSFSNTVLEMRLAKYTIETNMNKKCRFFAYPYGKMNASSTLVAQRAGCEMVFVGRDANARAEDENLFELPRHTICGNQSGADIIELIKHN